MAAPLKKEAGPKQGSVSFLLHYVMKAVQSVSKKGGNDRE
ncbi:hypothetical protein GC56T2_0125 [Geobacillus sp. C56-T2]|nr:hypothetical protein GC56T2_0125 [Geobacillus sp. C56-T2]